MPSVEEFKSHKPTFTFVINGHFGSGKTHLALTFPRVYHVSFITNDLDILYRKGNERLLENLVHYEMINPATDKELSETFNENTGKLRRIIDHMDEMGSQKKIDTVVFDGFTYCVDLKWRQINLDEQVRSQSSGNIDKQTMYLALSIYLTRLVGRDILPMVNKNKLNLLINCHLKRESEETLEGKKQRAGKIDKMSDIAPQIEGGFRNKIEGLLGASLYLDKIIVPNKPSKYIAYCDKTLGMGTVIVAKNRYGLPAKVDNINYQVLMSNMNTVNLNKKENQK